MRRARSFAGVQVAMFMPLNFLQSGGRAAGLWREDPPDEIWVVPERVTMYPRGEERDGSGTQATAWYVWDGLSPRAGGQPRVRWLPVGANKRYAEATVMVRVELLRRLRGSTASDRPRAGSDPSRA